MTDETDSVAVHRTARSNPRSLVLESAAIFLSVLFAFLVEQWREERNELEEAQAAMELVRAELEHNLSELDRVSQLRRDALEGYLAAMDELKGSGRFSDNLPVLVTPEITTIAYDLATDSGAVTKVATEDLLTVARAYEALESVRRNDVFLAERNAQIRFNDGEQYISGFIYYTYRAIHNEPLAAEHVRNALVQLSQ